MDIKMMTADMTNTLLLFPEHVLRCHCFNFSGSFCANFPPSHLQENEAQEPGQDRSERERERAAFVLFVEDAFSRNQLTQKCGGELSALGSCLRHHGGLKFQTTAEFRRFNSSN